MYSDSAIRKIQLKLLVPYLIVVVAFAIWKGPGGFFAALFLGGFVLFLSILCIDAKITRFNLAHAGDAIAKFELDYARNAGTHDSLLLALFPIPLCLLMAWIAIKHWSIDQCVTIAFMPIILSNTWNYFLAQRIDRAKRRILGGLADLVCGGIFLFYGLVTFQEKGLTSYWFLAIGVMSLFLGVRTLVFRKSLDSPEKFDSVEVRTAALQIGYQLHPWASIRKVECKVRGSLCDFTLTAVPALRLISFTEPPQPFKFTIYDQDKNQLVELIAKHAPESWFAGETYDIASGAQSQLATLPAS